MNENRIEALLRKAPPVTVPKGLKEQLQAAIRLPGRAETPAKPESMMGAWWKRLLPITACVLLASIAVVQAVTLRQLKRENRQLQERLRTLEQIAATKQVEADRTQRLALELDRLRKEYQELQQLRIDREALSRDLSSLEVLRAENEKLKSEHRTATNTVSNMDSLEQQKAAAHAAACINNLKILGVGARVWQNDNNGPLPTTFSEFKDEVGSARNFFCPADAELREKATMQDVEEGRSSYLLVTPGASVNEPDVVLFSCPHHGHVGLADGSVQAYALKRDYQIGKGNKLERK